MNDLVHALANDPPEINWRVVRDLLRLEDREKIQELIFKLRQYRHLVEDPRIDNRLKLALGTIQSGFPVDDYVLVKGRGAFKPSELEAAGNDFDKLVADSRPEDFYPVVDFHVHPKVPDLKFLADFREAGVTHAVILAADTDPADVDRPEVQEKLRQKYSRTSQSQSVPFEEVLEDIRGMLHRPTHVTNQDVADWVEDYPHIFFGFGSVDLCKDRDYVEERLQEVERLKLRGIKLLPFAQFFNPAENENMDTLFEYCRRTGSIILSHSGCAAGLFETPEMASDAHPSLWENMVRKYPEVTLVLAHFGAYSTKVPGIWLKEGIELVGKYPNVYADLAAVNWILDRESVVKEIREAIGFDRVLFATDYTLPLFWGMGLAHFVNTTKSNAYLTEEEKRQILGENAARLLGIN